jgi:uncharacterized protein YggE
MAGKTRFATIAVLTTLALLSAGLGGCTKVVTTPNGLGAETVTATGSGTVSATPDQAKMSFGVTRTSSTAKKALDATSKTGGRITAALRRGGVDKKDIQTQHVSLHPQTRYRRGKAIIIGYRASVTVKAKVRDISKLGDVVDAANDAGADEINGPTFSISENAPYRSQAAEEAVTNARKTAEAMAKAAGVSVGRALSITDGTISAPSGPLYEDRSYGMASHRLAAPGVSVPIEAGQLDVTTNATVIFELT